jgi:cytochrome c5
MKLEKFIFSPKTKAFSRLMRLSALLAILFMLTNFGCQRQAVQETYIAPSPSEAELFKSKCSKCHAPELALKKYRSTKVWFDTITRMKKEHNADVNQEEIELLVKYHVTRQKQEAAIFNEKCQKCHPGKVFLEQNLTADQARAIIKRMQQKSGNTIEDKDIEIIIRYHVRSHQAALEENIRGILDKAIRDQTDNRIGIDLVSGVALFLEKCSLCHEPDRALAVFKDPEVWAQTIKRMQYYSKGAFTDEEAKVLVGFHVDEQQRELNTFEETCTKCHDDERINSRSKSDEQWLATIKRMQQKAPELISDEKINLLAAYFHRRELTMARIFYNRCWLCHRDTLGGAILHSSTIETNRFIVIANEESGESLRVTDAKNLLSAHAQRQERNMQVYESKCATCHPNGLPEKKEPDEEILEERTRAEWISFIATLQGMELTKEIQNTINSQIDYHISKY